MGDYEKSRIFAAKSIKKKIMCTVSVEVNEKMLRGLNPNLDSMAAISQWVQQLVNYHTQLMVDNNGEATDMKFSHDMTPEELYDVIAEEIDHIYAAG